MGWTIGGVKERYLKLADAGDQAVGRRANLSDPHRKEFAVSNPYFDFTSIDDPFERESRKKEIDDYLKERLPSDCVDDQARDLAKVLFASICYHYDYLESHVHANCPFRQSAFFNDIPKIHQECIKDCISLDIRYTRFHRNTTTYKFDGTVSRGSN